MRVPPDITERFLGEQIVGVLAFLAAPVARQLVLFLILPEERTWLLNNPLVYLIYLPAAITLVLFPLVGYADGQPLLWFRTVRMFECGAAFLIAAGVAIFNYFRMTSIRTRQQMKIVLISCLAALIPLSLVYSRRR